jgi:hypothetical protein
MLDQTKRGSERLLAAWNARRLTEEGMAEIAKALDASPAAVEAAVVSGGEHATGVRMTLAYDGDDTPWCGNDLRFWLEWHRRHGGSPRPPRIIIDGTPWPEWIRLVLEFGSVGEAGPGPAELPGEIAEFEGLRG